MIRPIASADTTALLTLASEIGLFGPNELEVLKEMLSDYFSHNTDKDEFWIVDDDDGLVGVAYYALAPMTDRAWYIYLIGIRPDRQGQGRGRTLLRHIEQVLTTRGERLLLVETSGVASFEGTRTFYRNCGYEEEARIRDFYGTDDDKIVFRKVLAIAS